MQLKKLQLLGFKTFADKTEIAMDTGLTAIVGPNGSGKSNLVDALLWVLGEQNPRLLRGNNAQDVIFAGTDKRKPLGMAEVRLTIDNSDGTLPVKFAEVTITRRVYRSGESQYLLNGSPCRLKDIVELFLDTGVGKGAYAFVSQSEIDSVLSARPEDRRELFEEAAGIKKYRVKKKEALKKLESAEANLNRVRDIILELDVQREPMEQQALAARRYLLLQERLHEIEVGLLVTELQKADYEIHAARQECEEDQAGLLELDAELTRLDRVAQEVGEQLAQIESELESARLAQQSALQTVERTESRLALLNQRGQAAQKTQEQMALELADIAERRKQLMTRIEVEQEERDASEREEQARSEEWAGQKAILQELDVAVGEAAHQAETRQWERLRLAQERAGRDAALKAAQERWTETGPRLERLQAQIAALAQTLAEIQNRERQALERRDAKTKEQTELGGKRREIETQQQAIQAAQAQARTHLDSARRVQAEQSARLNTLTELQQSHEGFYQGVRAVLNAHKRGQITGHYQAVVDLLMVPEPYRVAVEVALGGSLQDIVTQTEAEAKAGIQWLKQNRAGRATFLAIPLLRSGGKIDTRGNNEIQCAMDLVEFAPEYATVAQYLLGRVLVVETMDDAIAASRRMNGWSKIVTLEGELLSPGGALTGGSLQGRGAHLVGRKGEMDDLKSQLPGTRSEVDRLTKEVEAQTKTLQELEAERNALARQEATAQAEAASAESARSSAERERIRLAQDRTERENAATNLAAQIADLQNEVERITQAVTAGQIENTTADDALAALTEEAKALASRRDAARLRAIALEVETGRLREKREGLTRTIASDRATLAGLEQQERAKVTQRDGAKLEATEAVGERERLTALLEEARQYLAQVNGDFARWRDTRQEHLTRSFETNNAVKSTSQARVTRTQNLHATELRQARLDVQIAQAVERLQEEYNICREEALARPLEATPDKNTAMEVGRLRRELRGMGQVNTGAAAEFERLTERYEFLTGQQADLDKSRASLFQTIHEIDDSTRGVFMETFEAVQVEFDRLFTRLFEGGGTKLVLTNPEDIFETGIEVIAQPPGKKSQHLSLLSGGERALTATALLFAFLAVKPSPFVLLDEVDAPLDGANVEKFTRLVTEFSQRSQFLLITHNPTTMEAAPSWYGVTMREPGISSILSYRVPQEATVSEAEQAVVLAN